MKYIDNVTTKEHIDRGLSALFLTSILFLFVALFFIFNLNLTLSSTSETVKSLYVINCFIIWVTLYILELNLLSNLEKYLDEKGL